MAPAPRVFIRESICLLRLTSAAFDAIMSFSLFTVCIVGGVDVCSIFG
jgi:hypothetical protein